MTRTAARSLLLTSLFVVGLPVAGQIGPSDRAQEAARQRSEIDLQRRMRDMAQLEQRLRAVTKKPPAIPMPADPKLSDEARARILKQRRVEAADLSKYGAFLKQDRTGIFKIFPDLGCVSKNVISASAECERAILLSSWFTFRTKLYGDDIYHDIHFTKDRFTAHSFFSQGIFAELGETPIEKVRPDHAALKTLLAFQSANDPQLAKEHASKFAAGLDLDGFHLVDSITPRENASYVFRTIAYRLGNALAPISEETTMTEAMFHSLTFDKRLDMTVVFQVLRKDELGGLTIIWKEIDHKDAAKIKFAKGHALRDFKPDTKLE